MCSFAPDHRTSSSNRGPHMSQYTAVIQRDGKWWIGWIEEIQGVNCQGRTRKELMVNLRSALREILQLNRTEA